jgi:hypothetical protein
MAGLSTLTKRDDVPKLATGVLVSYTGSLATVNIRGQQLTLPMLDSVSSSIAVGSTVLCQVNKNSGFVIGSVNTVSRTTSAAWTGGFSNPPVPRPSTQGIYYSNISPNARRGYDDFSGTFSGSPPSFTQNDVSGGAWFYGSTAFSSLSGKTLVSLEVYLPALSSGTYPLAMAYHLYANPPGGLGGFGSVPVNRSGSGWVSLPSTWVTTLASNLSGFGVGVTTSTNTAVISNALPYGTLRIGWSK